MVSEIGATPILFTPAVAAGQVVNNLTNDQTVLAKLEEQLSTGYSINQPSDNPAQAVNILNLKAAAARASQYEANASDGEAWLQTANSALNQILSTLQNVQQVVLSADAPNTVNQASLDGMAEQVSAARQALLNLANTTYGNQAIFAGTGSPNQVNSTGVYDPGVAYDTNGNYVGGQSIPTRTVAPGISVPIAVTGQSVFGSGSSSLLSPPGILVTIENDLRSGHVSAVTTTDLSNLKAAINTVRNQAAIVGAQYQRMQTLSAQASQTKQALQTEFAAVNNVNLPKAATELQQQQNSYQAALWAASQLVPMSLVDFLS